MWLFRVKTFIENRYIVQRQDEKQRKPCVAPSAGHSQAATGVKGVREMVLVRPGKERAIHESCKQGARAECACRPRLAGGHVSQ